MILHKPFLFAEPDNCYLFCFLGPYHHEILKIDSPFPSYQPMNFHLKSTIMHNIPGVPKQNPIHTCIFQA